MQTISSNAVAGVERELDVTDNSFLCSLFHNASIMRICDGALSIENDCFFKPEIKRFQREIKDQDLCNYLGIRRFLRVRVDV
jgi:hypothetical protein